MRTSRRTVHPPRLPSVSSCIATPCCTGCGGSRRSDGSVSTIPPPGSTCICVFAFETCCRPAPLGALSQSRRESRVAERPLGRRCALLVEQRERVGRVVHEVHTGLVGCHDEAEECAAPRR